MKSSPAGLHSAVSGADVTWNDWASYLRQFFKLLPKITNYRHFMSFKWDHSRKVICTYGSQVISLQTATLETHVAFMMEELEEEGLSLERQWYLYESVRQYVQDENKRDSFAPVPIEPKLKSTKAKVAKAPKH